MRAASPRLVGPQRGNQQGSTNCIGCRGRPIPAARATTIIGSSSGVWRRAPSSARSPRKAAPSSGAAGSCPLARRTPTAIGRPIKVCARSPARRVHGRERAAHVRQVPLLAHLGVQRGASLVLGAGRGPVAAVGGGGAQRREG